MTSLPPVVHFVTSNSNKAAEVEVLLGARVERVDRNLPEIQAASLEEIIEAKLARAIEGLTPPVAVEDVSLELSALGGFPGPYVKWLLEAGGGEALGTIASALSDRSAVARCLVAVWDGERTRLAEGSVEGEILVEPRGERAFGWDAWFLPNGTNTTYGEMSPDEKARLSHRSRAWRAARPYFFNP